jgi:hypothetical protein
MMLDVGALRAQFLADRCHHVVIPGLVSDDRAAAMRAQLDEAGFQPVHEPDRARYELNRELAAPELFDELRELVEHVVERPLQVGPARWLRLRHRDYALLKADAKDPAVVGAHLEVTLDFSACATGQAEIVYTDGAESWMVPQQPGSVAIVERDPRTYRYERYLDHRVAQGVIYRLRLALL